MDVMDTPEARDLFACLGAVDSTADAASLLRVAALPQFQIDPEKLRAGMRALPRDPQGQSAPLAVLLGQIEGGPAVLDTLREAREEAMHRSGRKLCATLDLLVTKFGFDRTSPPLRALLEVRRGLGEKPITKTGENRRVSRLPANISARREARCACSLTSRCGPPDDRARRQGAGVPPRLHPSRHLGFFSLGVQGTAD